MKVTAHPLMVAVALGLIGPQVLSEDDHCDDVAVVDQQTLQSDDDVHQALEQQDGPVWSQLVLHHD